MISSCCHSVNSEMLLDSVTFNNELCRLYVYTPRSVTRVIQSVFSIYCSIVHRYVECISVDQLFAFFDSCKHQYRSLCDTVFHQLDAQISISCVCVLFDQL